MAEHPGIGAKIKGLLAQGTDSPLFGLGMGLLQAGVEGKGLGTGLLQGLGGAATMVSANQATALAEEERATQEADRQRRMGIEDEALKRKQLQFDQDQDTRKGKLEGLRGALASGLPGGPLGPREQVLQDMYQAGDIGAGEQLLGQRLAPEQGPQFLKGDSFFNPSTGEFITAPSAQADTAKLAQDQANLERKLAQEDFKNENTLYKAYETDQGTKEFRDQGAALERLLSAPTNPPKGSKGASDYALLMNFAKALDPRSVVRESEFQLVGKAGGAKDYLMGLYTQLKSGQRLTPPMREDLKTTGKQAFKPTLDKQKVTRQAYVDRAERAGINAAGVRDFTSNYDKYFLPTEAPVSKLPGALAAGNTPKLGIDWSTASDDELLGL